MNQKNTPFQAIAAFNVVVLFCSSYAFAGDRDEIPIKNLILPGEAFHVEGRPAFIFWPETQKRSAPQPWVMYGPTLPCCPDVHEKWMHQQFLDAGIAVAGIDVGEGYGSPKSQALFTALYNELVNNRDFAEKPCLLGRSRGGLWCSSWAIRNTDKVAGFAGIYPVFDLRSYPKLPLAAPAYEMTTEQLQASLTEHNPIAKIDSLPAAKVPVFIIHGAVDKVVPLEDNSAAVLKSYHDAGADDLIKLTVVDDQGHNFWPGFFTSQDLVDFVINCAKSGSKK